MFLVTDQFDRHLLVLRGRIEDREESSNDQIVDSRLHRRKGGSLAHVLPRGNDGIVIRDLLIIDVTGFCDPLMTTLFHHIIRISSQRRIGGQSPQILVDLFRNCSRQDSGIRSRISDHFLLIQFLYDLQRLGRIDLVDPGAVILQFRKIVEERRILLLRLLRQLLHLQSHRKRLIQISGQFLCLLLLTESVFLIELRTAGITAALDRSPFSFKKRGIICFLRLLSDLGKHAVEGSRYKGTYASFTFNDHSQDAGHDTSHCDDTAVQPQVIPDLPCIFQGKDPGEIDPHQIVFLRTKICRIRKCIILRQRLRLTDPPQDLLVRLGIDPYPVLLLGVRNLRHLIHKTIDILSLPSGVGADIDRLHILPVQKLLYRIKLL